MAGPTLKAQPKKAPSEKPETAPLPFVLLLSCSTACFGSGGNECKKCNDRDE